MISPIAVSADDPAFQPTGLRQFLNWLLISCVIVAIGYIALWAAFASVVAGFATLAMVGLIVATLVSRAWLDRGEVSAAVMLISIALLITAALFTLINPGVMPILIYIPVLVIVIALPYIGGRALLTLMLVGVVQAAVMVACAQYVRLFEALPAWANGLINLVCAPLLVTSGMGATPTDPGSGAPGSSPGEVCSRSLNCATVFSRVCESTSCCFSKSARPMAVAISRALEKRLSRSTESACIAISSSSVGMPRAYMLGGSTRPARTASSNALLSPAACKGFPVNSS